MKGCTDCFSLVGMHKESIFPSSLFLLHTQLLYQLTRVSWEKNPLYNLTDFTLTCQSTENIHSISTKMVTVLRTSTTCPAVVTFSFWLPAVTSWCNVSWWKCTLQIISSSQHVEYPSLFFSFLFLYLVVVAAVIIIKMSFINNLLYAK